jgi:hypothetical protein
MIRGIDPLSNYFRPIFPGVTDDTSSVSDIETESVPANLIGAFDSQPTCQEPQLKKES